MEQLAIQRSLGFNKGASLAGSPEMALLGGPTPTLNRTRVMAANFKSSFSHPADLDAFLQGHFTAYRN